jgi:hypothetical protein
LKMVFLVKTTSTIQFFVIVTVSFFYSIKLQRELINGHEHYFEGTNKGYETI